MTDQPTQTPGSGHMPTYGEQAVGMWPASENTAVNNIKEDFADIIDELNDLRNDTRDPEVARMLSLSITNAQVACMWAVKSITWRTK